MSTYQKYIKRQLMATGQKKGYKIFRILAQQPLLNSSIISGEGK